LYLVDRAAGVLCDDLVGGVRIAAHVGGRGVGTAPAVVSFVGMLWRDRVLSWWRIWRYEQRRDELFDQLAVLVRCPAAFVDEA
jgi:predicted metalloendopeptidase